ncbi:U-box domain-containing protein [Senna tora]|uniref:U-box domain-containing protein n=1 Tax=Senna tora TaxID=362788 RepID=A0A834WQE1_9FABA|nr:U-box domain-containing protein [Senna tora]
MEKLKGWKYFKHLSFCPTKSILLQITSQFRFKRKGQRNRLIDLYKDMESCGEYEDIRVMWRMIQSSSSSSSQYGCITKSRNRSSYLLFCFRPT